MVKGVVVIFGLVAIVIIILAGTAVGQKLFNSIVKSLKERQRLKNNLRNIK